jgi:hypothetical protein
VTSGHVDLRNPLRALAKSNGLLRNRTGSSETDAAYGEIADGMAQRIAWN